MPFLLRYLLNFFFLYAFSIELLFRGCRKHSSFLFGCLLNGQRCHIQTMRLPVKLITIIFFHVKRFTVAQCTKSSICLSQDLMKMLSQFHHFKVKMDLIKAMILSGQSTKRAQMSLVTKNGNSIKKKVKKKFIDQF